MYIEKEKELYTARELGGAGNTPETPAGRLEDAMRWTSTPELSSYPGELKHRRRPARALDALPRLALRCCSLECRHRPCPRCPRSCAPPCLPVSGCASAADVCVAEEVSCVAGVWRSTAE